LVRERPRTSVQAATVGPLSLGERRVARGSASAPAGAAAPGHRLLVAVGAAVASVLLVLAQFLCRRRRRRPLPADAASP